MIRDHRFYQMQSALSATGHLNDYELEELEQHVSQCVSCRNCMVEMATVSRELFLTQAGPGNRETPTGMQQRFIQRAVAAGIPLKLDRASSAGFDLQFARIAAITVMLALLISLVWKVASTPRVQRASVRFPFEMKATPEAVPESSPQPSGGPAGHTELVNERRAKRRAAAPGRAVLKESPFISYGDVSHPHLALKMPAIFSDGSAFWSERLTQNYLVDGVRSRAYAANLFGPKWDGKPEERLFHLDLTLASPSRADSPLNAGTSAIVPNLKFNTSEFHIDSSRRR